MFDDNTNNFFMTWWCSQMNTYFYISSIPEQFDSHQPTINDHGNYYGSFGKYLNDGNFYLYHK